MAKKILKRSLALGVLMAFVITGSAMAAGVINTSNSVAKNQFKNDTFTLGSDSVILNNMPKDLAGIGDETVSNQNTIINILEGQTLTLNTTNAQEYGMIQNTIINNDGSMNGTVILNHTGNGFGAAIGTNHSGGNKVTINANEIKIDAPYSKAVYGTNAIDEINLNANKISINGGTALYAAGSKVNVKAKDSIVIESNDKCILATTNGNINVESADDDNKADIVINGNIEYLSTGLINVNLETEQSQLNGVVKHYSEGGTTFTGGTVNLTLNNGASWNVTGDSVITNVNADNGNINLGEEAKNIQIDTLTGDALNVNTDNTASSIEVATNNNKKITVAAGQNLAANLTDANQGEQLQALADVVDVAEGNKQKTVTVAAGDVSGAITAVTDGNGKIATVQEEANTTNAAVSDMASISLMTWRQENNDMNKRLGELRDSKGQHGAWARMARGESKYGAQNVKNQYNYYQVGYDEKLSTDPHWTVGVALTRTEGNSTFRDGTGENNHTGVAVYGSYLGDNGSFIDLIAKYARMDNEYKTIGGVGDADYKTNGYSVSAEYGKRFTKDNGLWIEPQVELTYGTVGSVNYLTSKDASVRQDGIDSFVGRIGFALGKNIKAGNVYARASYLYDFDGDTNVTFSKGGVTRSFEQDLGGGWWEVGIGSNINLSDATHLYFDVEKTYGGDVATPWQWNLGVRYSF